MLRFGLLNSGSLKCPLGLPTLTIDNNYLFINNYTDISYRPALRFILLYSHLTLPYKQNMKLRHEIQPVPFAFSGENRKVLCSVNRMTHLKCLL